MKILQLFKRRRKIIKPPKVFSSTQNQIVIPFRPISILLIGILLFCCFYLLLRSDFFLLHKIEISRTSNSQQVKFISEDKFKDEFEDLRGRSFFSIIAGEIEDKVKKEYPSLEKLTFIKKFPDKIEVFFEEKEAAALLEAKNGRFLLDKNGLIFAQAPDGFEAPAFQNLDKEAHLGEKIDSVELQMAIELIRGFSNFQIFHALFFNTQNFPTIYIKTQEGTELFFSGESNLNEQLATLQLIVKNGTIEGKALKKVDLSFKKPVVSY